MNSKDQEQCKKPNLPLTVLYDSECPLCNREIEHYKRLDPTGLINWLRILDGNQYMAEHSITFNQAMRELHVVEGNSEVHRGVDAFLKIWSRLKRYQILEKIVSKKPVYASTCFLYENFARWRFKKRCSESSFCNT